MFRAFEIIEGYNLEELQGIVANIPKDIGTKDCH